MIRTHHRACNLCEAICGIAIELLGSRITKIRGDDDDPLSRGHICPKAVALQDVHDDPDRLRRPLARRGGSWAEIPWQQAFEEAATRLSAVQRAHGGNAVAVYQGNPTVHNHGALLYAQLLTKALRTRNRFSATSVDQLPHMLASLLMFGHQLLLPVPDIDRTDFLLMLGANPLASNGSLMTAPDVRRRLLAIRKRGGRLIVIDPRRTETAEIADRHLFIRPGTDALLLMAFVRTLFEEGLHRPGRLESFSDGIDTLRHAALAFPPERVSPLVGIPGQAIRELARDFANAPSAAAYGRVGVSTQEFGGLCCWLLNAINVLTGNLDRPGGAMFPRPAADVVAVLARIGQRGHFEKGRTRVRGMPEFGGEYPASALAEEIETEGEGQIRALVTSAGNPVLSTPNGARLERALPRLEYMVAIDFYLNETTRHAHLILPPTSALERDHYDLVFHALAIRNTAKYSPPLFEPRKDARHDWQILLELARRLDAKNGRLGLRARLGYAAARHLGPHGIVDLLLRFGPYGASLNPLRRGLTLQRLRESPHGVDLGPLAPCLPARLYTKARRIDVAPARLVADVARLEAAAAARAPNGLLLIGRRDLRSNNSWMHNSERLLKGKERCTLLMHPEDAAARGLAHGQPVRLTTRAGSITAPLELSESVMRGVVSLPHGWGHGRPGVRLGVAALRPGASLNDLTDDQRADALCGTAVLNGVPVEIAACP